MVREVSVAVETVPIAPLLKVTILLAAVVLKPVPAIVRVAAVAASPAVLAVTEGTDMAATTCATCTAVPLVLTFVVTTAVKKPAAVGLVDNEIDSEVTVAAVTVPTAPPLNTMVLFAMTGLKPNPLITNRVPLIARLTAPVVTTGLMAAT